MLPLLVRSAGVEIVATVLEAAGPDANRKYAAAPAIKMITMMTPAMTAPASPSLCLLNKAL
jgi:hypothetical protein